MCVYCCREFVVSCHRHENFEIHTLLEQYMYVPLTRVFGIYSFSHAMCICAIVRNFVISCHCREYFGIHTVIQAIYVGAIVGEFCFFLYLTGVYWSYRLL